MSDGLEATLMSRRQRSGFGHRTSHQRNWLWGRYAVLETLRAGRWPIQELWVSFETPDQETAELQNLAGPANLRISRVSAERIEELCHAPDHQGFLARMGEFPCARLEQVLADQTGTAATAPCEVPLYVICDRIQDSHNFGAILRCCDAMRVNAVIIGEVAQASVTPHVARASAGAVNYQTIVRVPNLLTAAQKLRSLGIQLVAASEKSECPLWEATLTGPTAVIIGSEATGISRELLNECATHAAIPMLGGVNSLNAAVAAGILLYECRRQQAGPAGSGGFA